MWVGEVEMKRKRSVETIPKNEKPVRHISREERRVPHWLFQHEDLVDLVESGNLVDQEALTNTLNRIHFVDGYILVHLRRPKKEEDILVRAYPQPCLGSKLTCRWSSEDLLGIKPENYQFLHLVIVDGQSMILVPVTLGKISGNSLTVQLPPTSYAIGQRRARRYACHEVVVELMQSGFHATGELVDFSPIGFRIRVRPESSSSFHWFNPDAGVTIHLRRDQQTLFSGSCRCIRQEGILQEREIVLAPVDEQIHRFKSKQTRNPRQHLVPSPTLVFDHPLFKERVQLEVNDISTSGFSIHETADEGVLMPGMIIPELTIDFAGAATLKCAAQVIYRLEEEEASIRCSIAILDKEKSVRCGIAILDMDINTYSRLTHILTNALDPHAYISSEVNMEALWKFFFDSGFIYPKKYRLIQSHREDFKETYRRLYQEKPEISSHFTCQKHGRIYGHISMVRAYERAWMIHHYAAKTMGSKRTAFMVLREIMHYLNDLYRLPSANIDYVICYFRPENRFPDIVFGDFARALKNPRGCSMDLFSYLPYTSLSLGAQLPEGWSLKEWSTLDLAKLDRFYNHYSGGLLLDALGLGQECSGDEPLEETYSRLGFLRKWRVYCLKHKRKLNAVLIADQSDLAFNLSELLNSIKILVTNPEDLPWNVLSIAISQLAGIYHMDRVPILFYPFDYVTANKIPYEKQYQLWVLNVQHGNEYLEYMKKKFGISYE